MKKLLLLLVFTSLLISCNQKTQDQVQMEAAMALYKQNAKVVHALFDSLENEDLETAASFFAKEAKFNPPAYGGEDLDKKGIIDNYNGFMQVLDNIKASDRDFYPTVDEFYGHLACICRLACCDCTCADCDSKCKRCLCVLHPRWRHNMVRIYGWSSIGVTNGY